MGEVTVKSTKAEIMSAYEEAKKQIESLKAGTLNPIEDVAKKKMAETIKMADEAEIESILSPDLLAKYTAVKEAIEAKHLDLQELYGVEKELQKMVISVNAAIELERKEGIRKSELALEYKEKVRELEGQYDSRQDELNKQIVAIRAQWRAEEEEYRNNLLKEHEREEKDYQYEVDRKHRLENDKWEDEKKQREDALALKEKAYAERLAILNSREAEITELEAKVADIPNLVEKAKTDGYNAGKADAGKEYAFQKRSIETEAKHARELLNMQLEQVTRNLNEVREEKNSIQVKIEKAYEEMQKLASTVAESSGVKLLNTSDGSYNKK